MREWLIEKRLKKGFGKYELGKIVGVSGDLIGKYERGERRPSVEVAQRLGKTLGFKWTKFYS